MKSQSVSLEIDDNADLHQIEWRIQRAGWLIWGVIIAAGLLGLLGSGPISSATATGADDSLSIDYDRFVHYHHNRAQIVLRSCSSELQSLLGRY